MLYFIFYTVALLASVIGKICGMGGGVLMKPILDATGSAPVAEINFLSGCTVLAMSLWSVGRGIVTRDSEVDYRVSVPLAAGAALGGFAGKYGYRAVSSLFETPDTAGGVQAALLFAATLATLVYTIFKDKIKSRQTRSTAACLAIGLVLGALGAFLGIGGGPFNMAVLYFFFSMETKKAAQNSLFIIMVSQLTALLTSLAGGLGFSPDLWLLFGMVACGIAGSEAGARISKKLPSSAATRLFEGAMVAVMLVCVWNFCRFTF